LTDPDAKNNQPIPRFTAGKQSMPREYIPQANYSS